MCPLGAPLDPMITKIMPQISKIHTEGLQNDDLKCKQFESYNVHLVFECKSVFRLVVYWTSDQLVYRLISWLP